MRTWWLVMIKVHFTASVICTAPVTVPHTKRLLDIDLTLNPARVCLWSGGRERSTQLHCIAVTVAEEIVSGVSNPSTLALESDDILVGPFTLDAFSAHAKRLEGPSPAGAESCPCAGDTGRGAIATTLSEIGFFLKANLRLGAKAVRVSCKPFFKDSIA